MKQPKPLTRGQYLKRFSRSARWRLGTAEAAEAIADYHEMVFQEERDETKLTEELGDPVQAAWLLTNAREYKWWIRVFSVLAFGLLLLAKWIWTGLTFLHFSSWDYGAYNEGWRGIAVMAVGIVLSQVWFRRYGWKSEAMSKWLLLSLAIMMMFLLGTIWLTWYVLGPRFLAVYAEMAPETIPWQIILNRELIIDGGTACALIALAGLVLARCCDRRWLALYTLALTAAALCMATECWMHSMDLSCAIQNNVQMYVFSRLIPVGAVGLIGTGVALC